MLLAVLRHSFAVASILSSSLNDSQVLAHSMQALAAVAYASFAYCDVRALNSEAVLQAVMQSLITFVVAASPYLPFLSVQYLSVASHLSTQARAFPSEICSVVCAKAAYVVPADSMLHAASVMIVFFTITPPVMELSVLLRQPSEHRSESRLAPFSSLESKCNIGRTRHRGESARFAKKFHGNFAGAIWSKPVSGVRQTKFHEERGQ